MLKRLATVAALVLAAEAPGAALAVPLPRLAPPGCSGGGGNNGVGRGIFSPGRGGGNGGCGRSTISTPEPLSILTVGVGLGGAIALRRRFRK